MNQHLKLFLIIAGVGLALYGVSKTASVKALIKRLEGFSPEPYKDGTGYSIGYGHFIKAGDPYWPQGNIKAITEAQADALLDADLAIARNAVLKYTRVPLTGSQLDALSSFVYNVGVTAFSDSTLLKKLNAKDFSGALAEFGRWITSNGKVEPGLITRRETEKNLFAS